jgi:hypothetical protein
MSDVSNSTSRWTIGRVLVVVMRVACAIGAVLLVFGAVRVFEQVRAHQSSATCQDHLRMLGGVMVHRAEQSGTFLPAEGTTGLIMLYRDDSVAHGREWVFKCPGDDAVPVPDGAVADRYATADLSDRAALQSLCSYAVRDFARFPVEPGDSSAWILCDRQGLDGRTPHHRGGLNILRADGAAMFKRREELGLALDGPIVVGPDSPHPELRKMIFFSGD